MLFYILSIVAAYFLGAYTKPAFKKQQGVWYFYYNVAPGKRNTQKLF